MSTTVLQKCVEELKKEKPDIRYVLGILETFIDMTSAPLYYADREGIKPFPVAKVASQVDKVDEEQSALARAYTHGPIGNITT